MARTSTKRKTDMHDQEVMPITALKPHPRNYRDHPEDQVEHLIASLEQFGFYRNVVISVDDYILAGHGIIKAATRLGLDEAPVVRMPFDHEDWRALKLLAADNYLSWASADDDRALTDLLRELAQQDELFGTGFDAQQLAALAMVTRPASEIADFDAAAEWLGMPEFESMTTPTPSLTLHFDTEADRNALVEELGVIISNKVRQTWSAHWPPKERDDNRSLKWEG